MLLDVAGRIVQFYSKVHAQDEEIEVQPHAGSPVGCQAFGERLDIET